MPRQAGLRLFTLPHEFRQGACTAWSICHALPDGAFTSGVESITHTCSDMPGKPLGHRQRHSPAVGVPDHDPQRNAVFTAAQSSTSWAKPWTVSSRRPGPEFP